MRAGEPQAPGLAEAIAGARSEQAAALREGPRDGGWLRGCGSQSKGRGDWSQVQGREFCALHACLLSHLQRCRL